ncbi:hypothetical protein E2C01_004106 [Portunus trituberculatus]|uniref:Uncharacterized protein n=1 Tax=Portunus trituberculatus TaxID=210409 RepID=A0A5B7CPR5_PORTR|nr:hypothetical protein [Portunus trituberculatus]
MLSVTYNLFVLRGPNRTLTVAPQVTVFTRQRSPGARPAPPRRPARLRLKALTPHTNANNWGEWHNTPSGEQDMY